MNIDNLELDVTSLHHRRAVHRWERTSVGDMFERLTWSTPDADAVVGCAGAYGDDAYARLTYRQADRLANQVANGLLSADVRRGDVVMLFCENSVEAFLCKIGCAKAGLVAAPLNPMMAPDMVAAMFELVAPKLLIVDGELWPRIEPVLSSDGPELALTIPIGSAGAPGSPTFADFVRDQPDTEPDVEIHGDDIWQILFTSGTTALPKGVLISHSSCYLAAYGFALSLTRGLQIESDLRVGTYLPMIYHVGEQIFAHAVFLSGGTLIIGRGPDPARIAEMIDQHKVTSLWAGSPAMIGGVAAALSARPELSATSLTTMVYGWAELAPSVHAAMKEHCGEQLLAFEIFGQTESISCHRFWPDKWRELYEHTAPRDNYVGIPSPLLASTLMDPLGQDLAGSPGVAGEAVYRSPSIMAGYYRNEPATREALRDGWFHSGDSCAYDEDGLRIMLDRYKDIVKTGGENVSSLRVEAVLHQHPDIAKAVVIGLPHPHWGDAVTAVVVAAEGTSPDPAEIVAFCRARLGGYETPKRVIFADSVPETVGGKVLKYKLRTELAATYADEQA